ncbi:sigma-70 family RNA polymerase sigma factor [Hymenobacter sp. BT188]|uniref:RNA polymerase sigma factor n=1 Tax=Hymenobacter sp. BT188 TaxID=2763504 RepID=UPI001650D95F|nr:sigma-70 family RNA polymerase sigma factor [Hymenobacter sp. BT188]MBC6608803.1 sigma-70 family RNA polymerase sigma factor [Hymenobacter sp. BT188]
MSTERDEKTLLRAVASGDRDAFSNLYSMYLNGLYRYTCLFVKSPEEAEEIVQEVFVRLWERRGTLPQLAACKAYAYQITKNLVVDHWRQQQRMVAHRKQFRPEVTVSELADTALIYQQDYQMAQRAIAQLPPKRKQIFLLSTQHELSLAEIAQLLSISKPVVKKQLYSATAFVKTYLKQHGNWSFGAVCLLSAVPLSSYSREMVNAIQALISG